MFQDLDATLAALLHAELPVANVAISFAAPDNQFPPSGVILPAVAFFLYDMRENTGLRPGLWDTERQPDNTFTRKQPPPRVDCSYLITAWPSPSVPDPAEDEHRLLGAVMKVLLRHRTIPGSYLRGELAGQDPPMPAKARPGGAAPQPGRVLAGHGRQAQGPLHYAVTVSVDVFEPRAGRADGDREDYHHRPTLRSDPHARVPGARRLCGGSPFRGQADRRGGDQHGRLHRRLGRPQERLGSGQEGGHAGPADGRCLRAGRRAHPRSR